MVRIAKYAQIIGMKWAPWFIHGQMGYKAFQLHSSNDSSFQLVAYVMAPTLSTSHNFNCLGAGVGNQKWALHASIVFSTVESDDFGGEKTH